MEIEIIIGKNSDRYNSDKHNFDRRWALGKCSNSVGYSENKKYLEACCLKPGIYSLICRNLNRPFGWGNGFIKILGKTYCNDFIRWKAMRKISITGMNTVNITLLND